ncbi:type VI secretion system tip protein TssI/VgrG [Luteibacter sp. PPL554]
MSESFDIACPAGHTFRFASMTLEEGLGRPFAATVEALCLDRSVDLEAMLGTTLRITRRSATDVERHVHGVVASARHMGELWHDEVRHARYRFHVVPRLGLLARSLDSRIHTDATVPDIVRQVLADAGCDDVAWRLSGQYPMREYCVQYRESHLDFVSRLMEDEGIYYFFEHEADRHTLVIADAIGAHRPLGGGGVLRFAPSMQRGHRREPSVDHWEVAYETTPASVHMGDYDYLHPRVAMGAHRDVEEAGAGQRLGLGVVDFPAASRAYDMDADDLDRRARIRGESLNASRSVCHGRCDAAGVTAGVTFQLREHALAACDAEYLVVSNTVEMVGVDLRSGHAVAEPRPSFRCAFHAIPASRPYRSPRSTPRPIVHGVQTAVVDGSADEMLAVDALGRIKVRFFWSAADGKPSPPSCFVRVASPWAGRGWGALQLPRVGQEVVVGFLEGDPDRPLVLGSVYNQDHMPPYALPNERARSGIVSRSLGGGAGEANELRFDDSRGAEELYLHGQRDLRMKAEHDGSIAVGRDATVEAGRDRRVDIGRDAVWKIGRRLTIEAMETIEFVVGPARIVMKRTGDIQIVGTSVKCNGMASVNVTAGASLALNAGAAASIKAAASVSVAGGAAVSVNAGAVLSLTAVGPAMLKGLPSLVG